MIEFAWCVLLIIIALPFVVYTCAKVGTYGYLKGRFNFDRDHKQPNQESTNEQGEGKA